ncbi:hypothetical protein JTE90_005214 [Oedothorax gibbosus]|uniref:Uncharacterized protein n=1 Tax=Oedothorax gibbosus TaxID=931172 RepID=A0AAV6UKC6_9ARAC|nr:hypothetical protein JTE90_005214 [Oedothorax gibbosus]
MTLPKTVEPISSPSNAIFSQTSSCELEVFLLHFRLVLDQFCGHFGGKKDRFRRREMRRVRGVPCSALSPEVPVKPEEAQTRILLRNKKGHRYTL